MTELCFLLAQTAPSCRAEDLHEMQCLALVCDVDDLIRMILVLAVLNGGQIRRRIQCCAVALENHAGRNLFGIRILCHVHDQRAVALIGLSVGLHLLHHRRNEVVDGRFAVPQIKRNIQIGIVALHIGNRHIQDVLPECPVSAVSGLKPVRILQRLGVVSLILLGSAAGIRINLLQISHRKRCLRRILAGVFRVKIRKLRPAMLQLGNDKAHLQPPVSQVNISHSRVSVVADHALDGLADDRRAKMTDMQRLGHIRSAIVEHHHFAGFRMRHAEFVALLHLLQIIPQELLAYIQVDKARLYNRHILKYRRIRKLCRHIIRNHKGRLVILLGSGHCAVALVFRKVRAGRGADLSHGSLVSGFRKRSPHFLCQYIQQLLHCVFLSRVLNSSLSLL